MALKPFPRRKYNSLREMARDFRAIWTNRPLIKKAMRELLDPAFRERLMVVVTQVNGCRYCSYYHAEQSLKAGVPEDQLRELLAGEIPADTPDEELTALLYAQHWAESNTQPDPAVYARLVEQYGQDMADAIHIALRMIRMGNLSGNLFDFWLYRLSFGRLGLMEDEKHPSL